MVTVAVFPGRMEIDDNDGVIVIPFWGSGVPADGHTLTSTLASTEPRPVARLNAAPEAVKPVTPGTELLPLGVGWKGFALASIRL
jgi:hypothetical protein